MNVRPTLYSPVIVISDSEDLPGNILNRISSIMLR